MKEFGVVDLETQGFDGQLVVGCVLFRDNTHIFYSFKEFFNIIKTFPDKTILFAHNGGKFDYKFILSEAEDANIDIIKMININGSINFTLSFSSKNNIILRDSYLLLPLSLDKLGKAFNTTHKKLPFDMDFWVGSGYPCSLELIEYCKIDCFTLFDCLITFANELGIDKFDFTIAGTAFNILLDTEIGINKVRNYTKNFLTKSEEEFIRTAYMGGRTEVFEQVGNGLFHYDVNSMYPYVMANNYYPTGQHYFVTGHDEIIKELTSGNLGVVKCIVSLDLDMHIPFLGIKRDNKLLFPIGSWTASYTSHEILEAQKRGYQFLFIEGIFYESKRILFKSFVNKYYQMRLDNKGTAKDAIAKLILNSAYGKFAQRREYSKLVHFNEIYNQKDFHDYQRVGETDYYETTVTNYCNREINPIYAVFVTAYARTHLYNLFEDVLSKDGVVYYCDTDSVFCNVDLETQSGLGGLKLERQIDKGLFIAPKLYKIDDIIKAKGIRQTDELDLETLLKVGTSITVRQSRLRGFKELQRLGMQGEHFKYLKYDSFDKNISSELTKRERTSDYKTSPIRLNE